LIFQTLVQIWRSHFPAPIGVRPPYDLSLARPPVGPVVRCVPRRGARLTGHHPGASDPCTPHPPVLAIPIPPAPRPGNPRARLTRGFPPALQFVTNHIISATPEKAEGNEKHNKPIILGILFCPQSSSKPNRVNIFEWSSDST